MIRFWDFKLSGTPPLLSVVVRDLPKSPTGKFLKRVLRAQSQGEN